jgi:competence protein ComEC
MNKKHFMKPIIIAAGATALAGSLGFYVWKEDHRLPLLEIYVFDLASGRSVFIITPEDKRILIDGGSNSDIVRKISEIIPFYSRRIDIVIATNSEGKNVSGLIDIIERYKVDKVYVPEFTLENLGLASSTDQIYKTFIETLEHKDIDRADLSLGKVISLDKNVTMNVLFPAQPSDFVYSKSSSPEILFNISNNKNNITFLGNSTKKVQKYIATTTSGLKTDVLVFLHNPLLANISSELIDRIKPQNLIFSQKISDLPKKITKNSKNKKEVIDPLSYLGYENRFNLKEGTVKITSDGENISILDKL